MSQIQQKLTSAALFMMIALLAIVLLAISCSPESECRGGRQNDAGTCSQLPPPCDGCNGTCIGSICIQPIKCGDSPDLGQPDLAAESFVEVYHIDTDHFSTSTQIVRRKAREKQALDIAHIRH